MLAALLPLLTQANIFWGIFNLVPVSPLDGGHVVRNFLRMFLRDRTAFIIAIWVAFIAGALVIAISILVKYYILAFLIAWYVWMNFQQWKYFRTHGYPGD
jgi:Zn-dependent protease